jgi:hypothetical protein
MFGIPDPVIWIGYLLTILSVVACIVFSLKNWNKSDEPVPEDLEKDLKWEKEESELNEIV